MEFAESLYFSSNALNRLLSHLADEAFRELGLSSSYALLLMIVYKEPGIQPMALSRQLQLTPSTITRLVEKMEYRGYLSRQSAGRSTHINLTQSGTDLQPKLQKAWNNLQQKYISVLGERYTKVLTEMTAKAAEQISEA